MSTNPATLAASRAMLSRSNSVQSNLSAAAAATALKRASTHSASQQDLPSQTSPRQLQRRLSSASLSAGGRPGLHRRTSSMSERSFREKSPEEVARERTGADVTPEKPKRRGSFSLPMSLRSNSQQKKEKGIAPGVIQPLPGQSGSPTPPAQKKFKTSMREGRTATDARPVSTTRANREAALAARPMSPPTHSAMKLPHTPGIGSSSSSIRSFQTDLSSIAEDSPFDKAQPPSKAPQAHLYPIKSAMKGGSGPPSIISEAVSEESKSSLGAPDSKRGKGRVSFSDEQKKQEEANRVIMNNGKVTKANSTATRKGSASKEGGKVGAGQDGFLKPVAVAAGAGVGVAVGATALARSVSAPASPPLSPPVSPKVPITTVPEQPPPAPKVVPFVSALSMPTPPESQSTSKAPSQSPVIPPETPAAVVNGPTSETHQPTPAADGPPKPKVPTQATPPKPVGNSTTPVTIRVSPAGSIPQKQPRLPGSFPEPTPPSTAESALTAADAGEMADTLSPLPASPRSPRLVNDSSELDLQRGLSVRTLALVPEGAASPTTEKVPRRESMDSADSGTSVYSDAQDGGLSPVVSQEAKMAGVPVAAAAAATSPPAVTKKSASTQAQPKPAAAAKKKSKVNGESSKAVPIAIGIGAAAIPTAAAYLAATHQASISAPKRPSSLKSPPAKSPRTGTSTPRAPGSVRNVRTSLRENGPSTLSAPRTTLRSSSVPPLSSPPREKKTFRTSMRDGGQTDEATQLAIGLMALPAIERVPSDSSFKRSRPRASSVIRTTLRDPKPQDQQQQPLRRMNSDSSSEVRISHRKRSSSIFGRFKRKDSIDQFPAAERVAPGSRFEDSDDELPLPGRGIGRGYEDTESLPSPRVRKRGSITNFFWGRNSRVGSDVSNMEPPPGTTASEPMEHRRRSSSGSGSKVVSKRTGTEKRFQGLRRLFRIQE